MNGITYSVEILADDARGEEQLGGDPVADDDLAYLGTPASV
jgi:hypothetical protein